MGALDRGHHAHRRELSRADVDGLPAQASDLLPAQAEIGGGVDERLVTRLDRVDKALDLVFGEIALLARDHLGQLDAAARRARDQRVFDRAPHDRRHEVVVAPDRHGLVAALVQVDDPALDVVAGDPPERGATEGRKQVVAEETVVLLLGAGPQPELLLEVLLRSVLERGLCVARIDVVAALDLDADIGLEVARVDEPVEVLGALLAGGIAVDDAVPAALRLVDAGFDPLPGHSRHLLRGS